MALYKYRWDATVLFTAANAACSKIKSVKLSGDNEEIIMLETDEDMTDLEIDSVQVALASISQIIKKE